MIKSSINLLQAELKPEKRLVTLSNVVTLWVLVLIIMVALAAFTNWQNSKFRSAANQLKEQNKQLKSQMSDLKQQLEAHKADPALTAELATLKSLISHKRNLYSHLTNTEDSYIGGFAFAMEELSNLHSKDISLQHIVIKENQMSFSGFARNANAVPNWLTNFEYSKVLSGKTFQQMKMTELEESKLIEFSVASNAPFVKEAN